MFKSLKRLFATGTSPDRTAGHAPKARLGLESVEDRVTPSVSFFSSSLASTRAITVQVSQATVAAPGGAVSLNPQPLPPKVAQVSTATLGGAVSLNPQPLPPRIYFLRW